MTILVCGASGQVGRELVERAGARSVVGVDRRTLDITDAAAIRTALATHAPRLVINAAAYTAVDKAESEPQLAYAINGEGPGLLAAACRTSGIPLFHLSTDYVFDGGSPEPYKETAAPSPLGVYGRSKFMGEEAIRAALPEHLIMRVAWVFGTHGNNFVRTMLRLARSHPTLRVVADQHGAPTHAGAIAETLLQLADDAIDGKPLAWGTYHYTGEPDTSWHRFAEAIFAEAVSIGMLEAAPEVLAITTAEYPTPAKRPANSCLDGRLAQERLGVHRQAWMNGLREVLNNWKESS